MFGPAVEGTRSGDACRDHVIVKSLLLRNRRLTELLQVWRFRWRHRGGRPVVLVHQMARVGSATVAGSLRREVPGINVFHTHYLSAAATARFRAQFDRIHRVTGRAGVHREFIAASLLGQRIERGIGDRWRVVTLVRDPVGRTVSAFFKHFPYTYPELGPGFLEDPANVPALMDLFLNHSEFEHAFALEWFDREVREVFGIDVFATPFPHDAGFITLAGPFADLLVLRLEDLDTIGPAALGAFLDVPPIRLTTRNRSDDVSYRATYRRFLASFRPPGPYLDRMYDSRLARHFYRDDERALFRTRWEGGPVTGDGAAAPGVSDRRIPERPR